MLIGLTSSIGGGGGGPVSNATTISPDWKHDSLTYSNGNLTVTHSSGAGAYQHCGSVDAKASGEWYFEVLIDNVGSLTNELAVGIGNWRSPLGGGYIGSDTHSCGCFDNNRVLFGGTNVGGAGTFVAGDIMSVHLKASTGEVRFRRNGGTWTSYTTISGGGPYMPLFGSYHPNTQVTFNFGATAFAYAVPSGALAWTKNIRTGRYWRKMNLEVAGFSTTNIAISEMSMRLTSGGANQIGSGTPSASSTHSAPYVASNAVDGNVSTFWHSGINLGVGSWWQYDFGSGVQKEIMEIVETCRNDANSYTPSFAYLYSDDLTNFYPRYKRYGLSWTQGEAKTFTFSA